MIKEIIENNEELKNKFAAFYTYYGIIAFIIFFITPEVGALLFWLMYAFLSLCGIICVIEGFFE